jgi:hypothetical protein
MVSLLTLGLCAAISLHWPLAIALNQIARKFEMNARHVQLSDCWSLEEQPTTYYREAAARARSLQGDATTPRVKQYLDKMIAHCEGLAGRVEPGDSSAADMRYAGRSRMSRNHHRLQPGFDKTSREETVLFRGWITTGTGIDLTGRT